MPSYRELRQMARDFPRKTRVDCEKLSDTELLDRHADRHLLSINEEIDCEFECEYRARMDRGFSDRWSDSE